MNKDCAEMTARYEGDTDKNGLLVATAVRN
jgi:hypothetical protein